MSPVKILDRSFIPFLNEERILNRIGEMADEMNSELAGDDTIFIAILNGSFMFAADLMKRIRFPSQITFIKVTSYAGTQSTGTVQSVLGLNQSIVNRNVVIVEDIIDSDLTIDFLLQDLRKQAPLSLRVCSLLLKPGALQVDLKPDFVGFEVENQFLVGYGLDYDGYGRNLRHIYVEEGQ